ncbi:hypothetical protein G6F62_013706 [Rhizopus arrhizus]|nr:hypothetical protein G6F62_013706 [Rhizopus arrhizus]
MITAGIPTIFLNAADLGYTGTELQPAINADKAALQKFEAIRAHGALRMGLISKLEDAATRQHTPKVAFVAPAQDYVSSSGKAIAASAIDLHARALSMGKLHHAMMGTASVAIGTAAAVPGPGGGLAAGGALGSLALAHWGWTGVTLVAASAAAVALALRLRPGVTRNGHPSHYAA